MLHTAEYCIRKYIKHTGANLSEVTLKFEAVQETLKTAVGSACGIMSVVFVVDSADNAAAL